MFWTILNTLVEFIFSKNLIVRLPFFPKKNIAYRVFLWVRYIAGHEIMNDDGLNRESMRPTNPEISAYPRWGRAAPTRGGSKNAPILF